MERHLDSVERAILDKLYRQQYIGGRHTAAENVQKGFPSHLKGEVKKSLKRLTRQGYIIPKITSYGLHVSLNPYMIKEIERIISER